MFGLVYICERLKIFYKETLLFSGTNYPTINLFSSDVCNIKLTLDDWSICGNRWWKKWKKNDFLQCNIKLTLNEWSICEK